MKYLSCWFLIACLVLLVGCDSGPALPKRAKVSGTVTLDGQPMDGGEVRFRAEGQPSQILEVKGGAFSGEAFVGKNQVDVVYEKDGPTPHPMEAGKFLKVNVVDAKFTGMSTPFTPDVPATGTSDLKFEVTSAPK